MIRYIIFTSLFVIVSCTSLDLMQKENGSLNIQKDKLGVSNDDFFGNDIYTFSPVDNIDATSKGSDSQIDPKHPESMNSADGVLLESISPTEMMKYKNKEIILFSAKSASSLKDQLKMFLYTTEYKLIWNTEYDVIFENDVTYKSDNVLDVLKEIAKDLSKMGIDIHMNVYLKNNVVLVYSVRS